MPAVMASFGVVRPNLSGLASPATFPILGSSHRFLEQTQGETRRGMERLGRTSKMGERSLRRLLILGASSAAKSPGREGSRASPWLVGMLARKPRMLVTVALANKMARIVWALMAHGGTYKAPAAAV